MFDRLCCAAIAAAALAACEVEVELGLDAGVVRQELAATTTFAAVADARVEQASPAVAFGGQAALGSDASPAVRSYVRFDVAGLAGPISAAKLRLRVTGATADGPAVHRAATTWTEAALTWNNQPGPTGAAVADLGAMAAGSWAEIDVTALVSGNGAVGLVLISASTDGLDVTAREGGSAPQLVITSSSGPGCGDATCGGGETCSTCATDCGACPALPTAVLEADAYADASQPATRFGAAPTLAADSSPALETYLRFRVSGVTAPLGSVKLRLAVTNPTADAPAVYTAASDWSEATLSWNLRPARGATVRADLGAVSTIAEYDLTSTITGDGLYTLALVSSSSDGFAASSKEGATPPRLVLGAASTGPGFRFVAVGDHGGNADAGKVLDVVPANGDFLWSLGDLSYGAIAPEKAWCDFVKAHVGSSFPVVIVAGNHEARASSGGGLIDNFIAAGCLPNPLAGVVGTYGKQYHVDYPAAAPLARLIAFSPMTFDVGGTYSYSAGSTRYDWLAATIDEARALGIRWVIVATHLDCITMGTKTCEIGAAAFNLLIDRKVDLILQAHDHSYQRSKQLAHRPGCASIVPGAYDADCVADSGADGLYARGGGSVVVISGAGGRAAYPVTTGDAEAGYFASFMTDTTHGVARVAVTAQRIDVDFVRATGGNHADHFSIVAP